MSHFAKKCNGFLSYPNIENLDCPELWIPFVFLKRNSFKKVVTTKLFMNVHFCSLGMKTYRFQVVKSQVTLQEQLLSLRRPRSELLNPAKNQLFCD